MKTWIALAALLMAMAVPAANADVTFDFAIGYNATRTESNMDYTGPKDTARFSLVWTPRNDGFFMSYTHISHLSRGWPVNKVPEKSLDLFEVGYRFNFNKMF